MNPSRKNPSQALPCSTHFPRPLSAFEKRTPPVYPSLLRASRPALMVLAATLMPWVWGPARAACSGFEGVDNNSTSYSKTIGDNGSNTSVCDQTVFPGNTTIDVTVKDKGTQEVAANAKTVRTVVESGGQQKFNGTKGYLPVTAESTTVKSGGTLYFNTNPHVLTGTTRVEDDAILDSGPSGIIKINNAGNLEFATSDASFSKSRSNNFTGTGLITKSGPGSTTLTGDITQSGITVKDGTLELTGKVKLSGANTTYNANYDSNGVPTGTQPTDPGGYVVSGGSLKLTGGEHSVTDATVAFATLKGASGSRSITFGSGAKVTTQAGQRLVNVEAGTKDAMINMQGAQLTGDIQYGAGSTGTLDMDATSVWRMSRDSTLYNLAGHGGTIVLERKLGDENSPGAKLIIADGGKVTGQTKLSIFNNGGLGAQTKGDGILVVQANGNADTTAQSTKDGFMLKGKVFAGAYEYMLRAGDAQGQGQNWYLHSAAMRPATNTLPSLVNLGSEMVMQSLMNVDPGAGMDSGLNSGLAAGQAARPVYYAALNQNQTDTAPSLPRMPQDLAADSPLWTRLSYGEVRAQAQGAVQPSYRASVSTLHLGSDLWRGNLWGGQSRAGVYVSLLDGRGRVQDSGATSESDSHVDHRAYGAGAYAQQTFTSGLYLKSALQLSQFKANTGDSADAGQVRGNSFGGSLEIGQPFQIKEGLRLTPQAQLMSQHLHYSDANLAGQTRARIDSGYSTAGRLGVRLDWQPERVNHFIKANLWQRHNSGQTLNLLTQTTRTESAANFNGGLMELALGIQGLLTPAWSMTGALAYQKSISGAELEGINGQLGFAYRF